MQSNHNHPAKIGRQISIIALTFALLAGLSIVATVKHAHHVAATPPTKPAAKTVVPSQFSFTGATGWWQGATSKSDIALFPNAHNCFVSAQHKTGTIAADQAKFQKTEASLTSDGYAITPGATVSLSLNTNTGVQSISLQQSAVTAPKGASGNIEGGQEFGYLQLANGYLYIEGYCDTADELPTTIPALKAITFDASK